MFYDHAPESIGRAKQICSSCSVRADCADHARAVGEAFGVWGGESEIERAESQAPAMPTASTVKDAVLVALLSGASPRVRAVDVLRRELAVSPASSYRYLVRALRLGLVERRGRNLYPARRESLLTSGTSHR